MQRTQSALGCRRPELRAGPSARSCEGEHVVADRRHRPLPALGRTGEGLRLLPRTVSTVLDLVHGLHLHPPRDRLRGEARSFGLQARHWFGIPMPATTPAAAGGATGRSARTDASTGAAGASKPVATGALVVADEPEVEPEPEPEVAPEPEPERKPAIEAEEAATDAEPDAAEPDAGEVVATDVRPHEREAIADGQGSAEHGSIATRTTTTSRRAGRSSIAISALLVVVSIGSLVDALASKLSIDFRGRQPSGRCPSAKTHRRPARLEDVLKPPSTRTPAPRYRP
jgi:hypothetical protein